MNKEKYVTYKFVEDVSLGDLDFKSNDYILNKIIKKALIQCCDNSNNNDIIEISSFNLFDILEALYLFKIYLENTLNKDNSYKFYYSISVNFTNYYNRIETKLKFNKGLSLEYLKLKDFKQYLNNDENYFIKVIYQILKNNTSSINRSFKSQKYLNTDFNYIYLNNLEEEVKEND